MKPLRTIDAVMLPLPRPNIDTDQITPARYLQKPRADDFGDYLFRDLRYDSDGRETSFALNQSAYRLAQVVVAGDNFGCGSSREHAVWALVDYGFRAVIAPSLGDIFAGNALKNGLLTIVLPKPVVESLLRAAEASPGARVAIDLEAQTVTSPDGGVHRFDIDARPKHCLLNGQDEIDYTLAMLPRIAEFERQRSGSDSDLPDPAGDRGLTPNSANSARSMETR